MNSKSALSIATSAVVLVGALASLLTLTQSLKPSEKSLAELPRIPTSDIRAGSFALVPSEFDEPSLRSKGITVSILLLRDLGGHLQAFYVPSINQASAVPIDHYWNGGPPCEDFRPDFNSNDIACRASKEGSDIVGRHRWSLTGRNLTNNAMDLDQAIGIEENGFYVLYKHQ
jgi:hypothetical protein